MKCTALINEKENNMKLLRIRINICYNTLAIKIIFDSFNSNVRRNHCGKCFILS